MILDMEDSNKKICISLHKYFVSLITRRNYKKNLNNFKKESEILFKNCLDLIYKTNPYLKKLEKINLIKKFNKIYSRWLFKILSRPKRCRKNEI